MKTYRLYTRTVKDGRQSDIGAKSPASWYCPNSRFVTTALIKCFRIRQEKDLKQNPSSIKGVPTVQGTLCPTPNKKIAPKTRPNAQSLLVTPDRRSFN
uniref:Uncharacterized protein n=1 Tax=Romanomermis culicivorax TaxID=13658 RepID=A0A915IXJ2_ROMCU